MVFSSIPAYLDPTNWHQQAAAPLNHEQQSGGGGGGGSLFSSGHQLLPPPPPPPPPQPHGGGGAGSIRPGSMVDRARMANIPMPEAALKCPRCESTNTKFCYFNNYSLSQPRHFCKTCRRYWTRGGAMRSVPVGGGCRRNKRAKPKSPAATAAAAASTCSSGSATSTGTAADHIFQGGPLRFMSPLHNFSENNNIAAAGIVGSGTGNYINDFNFHSLGLGSSSSSSSLLGEQQWRVQQHPAQFPFHVDPSPLYPFEHHHQSFMGHQQQLKASPLGVKMEDSHHHHHQMRQLVMGNNNNNNNNDQFWSGGGAAAANAWTDLSGFSSSSTSHP